MAYEELLAASLTPLANSGEKFEPTTPCRLSGVKRRIAALQAALISREQAA